MVLIVINLFATSFVWFLLNWMCLIPPSNLSDLSAINNVNLSLMYCLGGKLRFISQLKGMCKNFVMK